MIYIDMDGVVANFDQSIINIFGEEYSDRVADDFWKNRCVQEEVFRRMPPIPEGIQMVKAISTGRDICFMTSTGGLPHHIDIAKQKLDFLHTQGLGIYPVAFCMNTKGKAQFAQPGALLIDDRIKVCEAWINEGGSAMVFTPETANDIVSLVGMYH